MLGLRDVERTKAFGPEAKQVHAGRLAKGDWILDATRVIVHTLEQRLDDGIVVRNPGEYSRERLTVGNATITNGLSRNRVKLPNGSGEKPLLFSDPCSSQGDHGGSRSIHLGLGEPFLLWGSRFGSLSAKANGNPLHFRVSKSWRHRQFEFKRRRSK